MPIIMPIKELRNTTDISNLAHKEQKLSNGAEAVDADVVFARLERKHSG